MNPDTWKLILSFGGLFLTTVTGPLLWAIVAESRRIRAELKLVRAEIKVELVEMEKRLNERIDTRLTHR